VKLFIRIFPSIGVVLSPVSVKSTLIAVKAILAILNKMGKVGCVKYLKVCSVCLQQCIGGHVVHDVGELGMRISRTGTGIPRIIPVYHRELIRQGSVPIIRLYLTIFALYRIINIPAKVKIKSITDPFSGENASLIDSDINNFIKLFCKPAFKGTSFQQKLISYAKVFVIWKKSPGTSNVLGPNTFSSHPLTVLKTGILLHQKYNLITHVRFWLEYTNNSVALKLLDITQKCVKIFDSETNPILKGIYKNLKFLSFQMSKTPIGKLAFLHEPAGKMRVIAMVDPFTQWALYPLHKVILTIVRRYKMDGTYNQVLPLKYLTNSAALYSLDLSSATDRLPISLQVKILTALSGSSELAEAWSRLLVDRTYRHPSAYPLPSQEVRYAVGQPMGALSSWAMLALTHHFIVQSAAWRAGYNRSYLYTNYALLGDDLVLGDISVMKQYLHILRALGVECGLHKSVISHQGLSLEFAKKTYFKGQDVSPVSLTEFIAACGSISEIIAFAKKYNLTLPQIAKTLGYGWRVVSSTNKPIGKLNAVLRGISIALIMPVTPEGVTQLFSLGKPLKSDLTDIIKSFIQIEYGSILNDLNKLKKKSLGLVNFEWLGNPLGGQKIESTSPLSGKVTVSDYTNVWGIPFGIFRDSLKQIQTIITLPHIYSSHKEIDIWSYRVQMERYKDLPSVFLDYLQILNGLNFITLDLASLSKKLKPEPLRGRSPHIVKIWNRWSSIFQGTKVDVSSVSTVIQGKTEIVIGLGSRKLSRKRRTINFAKANTTGILSKN